MIIDQLLEQDLNLNVIVKNESYEKLIACKRTDSSEMEPYPLKEGSRKLSAGFSPAPHGTSCGSVHHRWTRKGVPKPATP